MRTVAFVQARMGSTRLPGKSLMPIYADMSLVELVLRRVSAARELADVVLLTSDTDADDPLVAVAERVGTGVFRGSHVDVLGRFVAALDRHPADAVVRVCADNPFVDPRAIDELAHRFAAAQPCDYASNHTEASGLPDGIGAEIATAAALRRAASATTDANEREHVTAHIVGRPDEFRVLHLPAPEPPWPFVKLDVDTAEDFTRLRAVAGRLPRETAPLWDLATVMRCAQAA